MTLTTERPPRTDRACAPVVLSASVLGTVVLITAIAPLATDMYVPAFPLVGRDLSAAAAEPLHQPREHHHRDSRAEHLATRNLQVRGSSGAQASRRKRRQGRRPTRRACSVRNSVQTQDLR